MNTQALLKSPGMPGITGLTLPRTKLEQVAAMEILSLPKGILPPIKLQAPPAARTRPVARPSHWPICYQSDIWEEVGFGLLAFAASLLIFLVCL